MSYIACGCRLHLFELGIHSHLNELGCYSHRILFGNHDGHILWPTICPLELLLRLLLITISRIIKILLLLALGSLSRS